MASVAIVSGAVGRIECVMKVQNKEEIGKLLQGLKTAKESLMAAYDGKKEEEEEGFHSVVKETVQISYEIVDAIADAQAPRPKDRLLAIVGRPSRITELEVELDALLPRLQSEIEKAPPPSPSPSPSSSSTTPAFSLKEKESSGSDVVAELRKALLSKSPPEFLVACIHGESGMGKTTLAKKLLHEDSLIQSSFDVLGWVSIEHEFQMRRVLEALLQQLGPPLPKVALREMSEIKLIEHIFKVLEGKKYLLVLDGVAAVEDWKSILVALPASNFSRVVVTTHSHQVASAAAPARSVYTMPPLTPSQTHAVLTDASIGNSDSVVKAIFDISGGSPLITRILGKSLQAEAPDKQLVRELHSYLPHKGTPFKVLEVCYKRLAHHSKPCLLYLALFPPGHDVEVDKLYLLLAAEDLIPLPPDQKSIADALTELSHKMLVEVQQDTLRNGIDKSCKLHDQVRKFSISKASSEDFFEIADFEGHSRLGPNTRRVAIHLSKYRDEEDKSNLPAAKQIRSLLIFDTPESEQKSRWPSDINDLKEMSRLRVLNFEGVHFGLRKTPKGIDKLVLLRYLSFRGCWLEELPSSLAKLTHLETLDLLVRSECTMIISSSILTNMKRLLHLYLPRLYQNDGRSKLQLQGSESLEILVNFDTEACYVEALSKLKKLKILTTISKGHHEDLEAVIKVLDQQAERLQHSSVDIRNSDRYNRDSVSALRKVLGCKFLHSVNIQGQMEGLKKEVISSATRIAEIELDGCELEHDPMNILGGIPNLHSLVLSNDAFVGTEIVVSNFKSLKSMKLYNLQYVQKITIQLGAMPELSCLDIESVHHSVELSIPENLHNRLKEVQGEAYSTMLLPLKVHITTSH